MLTALLWAGRYPPAPITGLPMGRDGGNYAYLGSAVLRGLVPLRDLWDDHPPGIAYLDAAAFAVGGPGLRTVLVLGLLYSVVLVVTAAWAFRPLASGLSLAFGVSLVVLLYLQPQLLQDGNMTEEYALIPMCVALGCAIRYLWGRREPALVAGCGLGAGLAFVVNPLAATPLAALSLVVLAQILVGGRPSRELALGLGGFALAVTVTGIALFANGGRAGMVDAARYLNLYAPAFATPLLVATLVGCAVAAMFWVRRRASSLALFLFVMVIFDLVAMLSRGTLYPHNAILEIPAVVALVLWAASEMTEGRRRALGAAFAALVVGAIALQFSSFDPPTMARAHAAITLRDVGSTPLVRAIRQGCEPGRPIFVWGSEPAIYFLSGHPAIGRYSVAWPLLMPHYDNARRGREVAAEIIAVKPCMIVDASGLDPSVPPLDPGLRAAWRPDPATAGVTGFADFPEIYAAVLSNYRLASTIDGFQVWLPCCGASTG